MGDDDPPSRFGSWRGKSFYLFHLPTTDSQRCFSRSGDSAILISTNRLIERHNRVPLVQRFRTKIAQNKGLLCFGKVVARGDKGALPPCIATLCLEQLALLPLYNRPL